MPKIKLIILSFNLYLHGLYLAFLKKITSHIVKKDAPLSRKIIIIPHRIYEHSLKKWSEKEQKFILLLFKFNTCFRDDNF